MVEADRFNAAAICIIVLLFESINEICSRSSACNLPLYFMAQFSVYSRYTKFCVRTLKSRGIKWIIKRDDKGNEIEENKYNTQGKLDLKFTWKRDDNSNVIEENIYSADGKLDHKTTFKYEFDEKGNWIKKITFKNQIPKSIEEREFEYRE